MGGRPFPKGMGWIAPLGWPCLCSTCSLHCVLALGPAPHALYHLPIHRFHTFEDTCRFQPDNKFYRQLLYNCTPWSPGTGLTAYHVLEWNRAWPSCSMLSVLSSSGSRVGADT